MPPSDQRSARPSTSRADFICSGAMYSGDPSTVAVWVSDIPSPLSPPSGPVVLEMPKSSTFTQLDPSAARVSRRFAGLRSRWTMPAPWASAMASQASSTCCTASWTGSAPRALSTTERSLPSRYSITMKGAPSASSPTSSTRATCSLFSRTEARASRRKRATTSSEAPSTSSLTATLCPMPRCVASATTPIPPRPRMRSTRYFPSRITPSVIAVLTTDLARGARPSVAGAFSSSAVGHHSRERRGTSPRFLAKPRRASQAGCRAAKYLCIRMNR